MANAALKVEQGSKQSSKELLDSPEFKHLVGRRWSVSMVLLAMLFVSYYGYILVVATAKDFVNQRIGEGATTVAIPLGVAAIVIAFALTAFYVSWANKSYDPEVERLKGKLKH
ncbi:MAG TPA: DUF485 domain-containing protein [Anaeromyxobacteraceae bacterium]|nr:DUF485 domain-containing protein [Anaeromyxobacteraceae bacterium]